MYLKPWKFLASRNDKIVYTRLTLPTSIINFEQKIEYNHLEPLEKKQKKQKLEKSHLLKKKKDKMRSTFIQFFPCGHSFTVYMRSRAQAKATVLLC